MNIIGEHIVLRAVEEGDLPKLQEWANDPSIQSMLGGWHFPVGMQDQKKWYDGLSVGSTNQRFAIDVPGDGIVGTANLVNIDWQNRNGFHGMLIGDPDLRGKGIALDTVKTIMSYAFNELDLARLDTDIIEYNVRSIEFYTRKCGWRVEGIRPSWYFRKGRRWDKVVVGITRQQYEEFMACSI
ncbi:GNAT family N-acetyltransferase [Brevundimonas albigilva]|uniref:GNAT family N-acetyltransferase n=1 Tax=Brevundimonas albigilva TaxID=1312364 RepID=A0ABY4SM97_9CAUL|nr:GNAT family protein [Brevundimonas albigilva]URI15034.1 GNAT family N-acetyltransferase [Brevundimonas albigilva]